MDQTSRLNSQSAAFKDLEYAIELKKSLEISAQVQNVIQNETFGYSHGMSRDDSFITVPLPNSAITNSAFSTMPPSTGFGPEMTPVTPFAIETAAEKTQVRLCGDVIVSLKLKGTKYGISACQMGLEMITTELFESPIAQECSWLDLSGNMLQFDYSPRVEDVPGTVKSRKDMPPYLPNLWHEFTCLEALTFGRPSSDASASKRGNLMRYIPNSIFQITTLRLLSVSSNQLQLIHNEISQLVNLEQLDVDDNEIVQFPLSVLQLPKLRSLDLDHNSIEILPEFQTQNSLRTLRLRNNVITTIQIKPHLSYLKQLDLSGNNISHLPPEIGSLTKLRVLDLSSNILEEIPTQIGKLESLRKIYLEDNMLDTLSSSLFLLRKLTVMNCSRNNLTSIPAAIGNLVNLRELYVEDNALDTLPDEIRNLRLLCILCVSGNRLIKKPVEIGKLRQLRDLVLFNNKIRKIDMEILKTCESLIVFGLSANRIKQIPVEMNLLKNVRIIQLDANRISVIPPELGELKTLRYLSLNNNRIEEIPDALAGLENLVGLMIDSNSLLEIPTSIGQLTNLRILSAKDNYIESIPDSISLLVNIELFDVCNNRLTRLPTTLSEFKESVDFKTNNNLLELPPQEVADRGIISIKTYLDSGLHSPTSQISEFETTDL